MLARTGGRTASRRLRTALAAYSGDPHPTRSELERRALVEADGFEFHRTQAAFERDRRRDQLLRAAGWTPVRITWRQVNEGPEDVIAAVRATPG